MKTYGIHHISSIVGHAQRDIDFNAGILALRLVKQTLNYDDKDTFHLYYGNDKADTGLTTTFPIQEAEYGKVGGGQVARIQYAIRPGQSDFWQERLARYKIKSQRESLMDEELLTFRDPSGLHLALRETERGPENGWGFAGISGKTAIIGIHAATLVSMRPETTLKVLTDVLGYSIDGEDEQYYKLKIHDDLGGLLYLQKQAEESGNIAQGSVHHIAFRIKDDEVGLWHEKLTEAGLRPTEIKDRHYFRSIYFRERGGILIELASEGPGMTIDEDEQHLGERFIVPDKFKADEAEILETMMPLEVREIEQLGSYTYRNLYEYELVQKHRKASK